MTSMRTARRDESDRLVRVAALASDVLGEENGKRWLHTPNQALGGSRPLDLLDTDPGLGQVEEVLGRIECSVYS